MASSGNFPLWSPLIKDSGNLSKGNTRFTGATNNRGAMTSFAIPTGTKFYVELLVKQANYYNIVFGIANPEFNLGAYDESDASLNGFIFSGYNNNDWRTNPLVNGSRQGWNYLSDDTTALRVMALTINRVDNEIKCYFDNTLITNGTISISATETYHLVCAFAGGANANIHMNINGGHDSTGAGDFSAGGNADENGFGDFQNSPPSGFLAPSSANLPISADIDPASEDNGADENPTKQFNAVLYTGNGSSNAITGLGFKPDLVWGKSRSAAQSHRLYDSSRGGSSMLFSDTTSAAQTGSVFMTSFDTDGFTYSSSGSNANDSGKTYVAWCWKANGGTTASNTDGASTTTVQANTKAGFSIVEFPNYTSNSTFGHGLNSAPEFMIVKLLASTSRWATYHTGLTSAGYYVNLNTNDAQATGSFFNSTAPTDDVFSLGASFGGSGAGIAYCWHSVEGYSKFGKYTANDNADGPFVYTGFRPRLLIIRNLTLAGDGWRVYDTARSTHNPSIVSLAWNTNAAEYSSSSINPIDFLSNGFKVRTSNAIINNTSYDPYIYLAWGDVPFKYNNTF